MSQIKILIADPNEVYLDGIALEFLKREPDRVDLHGITENDYWEEFCGASEEYDIALINERMAGEEIPADRFRYIFILTETMDGTDLSVFSKKDIKTILKWVSASEIYDQVVNGCPFYEILAEREREEADRLRREEEQRAREKAERLRREKEERARAEKERLRREAEEKARAEEERLRREAEERARAEEERLRREAEERARAEEERLRREAEERARAEEERLRREAEEKSRGEKEKLRPEKDERDLPEIERLRLEVEKLISEKENRLRTEAEERARAEAERVRLLEEAKTHAEAENKARAEADIVRSAMERALAETERLSRVLENVRREAEEKAHAEVDRVRREAEEKALEAERVRSESEEQARTEIEKVRREAEEQTRTEIEKVRSEAENQARAEVESVRREAEDQARTEIEKVRRETEDQARTEIEKVRRETEEQARTEIEKVRREAEEQALTEIENVRREAEKQTRAEVERARREAEEQVRKTERIRREEERFRGEAEEKARAEAENLRRETAERLLAEKEKRAASDPGKKRGPEVILMHGSCGGAGKTAVALGIACCMSRMRRKVLYVDAEYMQDFQVYMASRKTLSKEALMCLQSNPADIYEKMKRFISREGFAYLPASPRYLQLYNVGMDAYFNLIRGAKASGEYDFIIVDADNSFGNVKATLFSIADRAVIVSRSGPEENARLAVLHEILDSESNTGQVLYVRNFAEESFRESSENNFGSRRGEPALKKKNVHKPAGEEQETSAVIERTAELRSLADLSKIAGIRELAVRIISLPEVSD